MRRTMPRRAANAFLAFLRERKGDGSLPRNLHARRLELSRRYHALSDSDRLRLVKKAILFDEKRSLDEPRKPRRKHRPHARIGLYGAKEDSYLAFVAKFAEAHRNSVFNGTATRRSERLRWHDDTRGSFLRAAAKAWQEEKLARAHLRASNATKWAVPRRPTRRETSNDSTVGLCDAFVDPVAGSTKGSQTADAHSTRNKVRHLRHR